MYHKEAIFEKIPPVCSMFILNPVTNKPVIYLREIQTYEEEFLYINVRISTIGRFLPSKDRTYAMLHYKRMHLRDSMYLMFQCIRLTCLFYWWNWCDRKNIPHKHGYGARGNTPQNYLLFLWRGERVSAIAPAKGILDVKVVKGASNGDTLYDLLIAASIFI